MGELVSKCPVCGERVYSKEEHELIQKVRREPHRFRKKRA